MAEESPQSLWARLCRAETRRDRRNLARYTGLMLVWAIVFTAGTWLLEVGDVRGPVGWALVAAGLAAAALVAGSFWNYLRHADELARTIQLHALAVALTAGFVGWTAFQLLRGLGISLGDWPSPTAMVVIVFYIVGTVQARTRYR